MLGELVGMVLEVEPGQAITPGSRLGTVTGDEGRIDITPDALGAGLGQAYRRVRGTDASLHARNFFDCVKTRQQPVCHSAIMRRSHVTTHAVALSWILGRPKETWQGMWWRDRHPGW